MDYPGDPVYQYFQQWEILHFHAEPQGRLPSGGMINLRKYYDNMVRVLTKQFDRSWRDHTFFAVTSWNRSEPVTGFKSTSDFSINWGMRVKDKVLQRTFHHKDVYKNPIAFVI